VVTFEDDNQRHHSSFMFFVIDSHLEGRVSSFRSSFSIFGTLNQLILLLVFSIHFH